MSCCGGSDERRTDTDEIDYGKCFEMNSIILKQIAIFS